MQSIINLMNYDEIVRTTLISTLVLTGVLFGYFMVRIGVMWMIKKENEIIKDLHETLRVLK